MRFSSNGRPCQAGVASVIQSHGDWGRWVASAEREIESARRLGRVRRYKKTSDNLTDTIDDGNGTTPMALSRDDAIQLAESGVLAAAISAALETAPVCSEVPGERTSASLQMPGWCHITDHGIRGERARVARTDGEGRGATHVQYDLCIISVARMAVPCRIDVASRSIRVGCYCWFCARERPSGLCPFTYTGQRGVLASLAGVFSATRVPIL